MKIDPNDQETMELLAVVLSYAIIFVVLMAIVVNGTLCYTP